MKIKHILFLLILFGLTPLAAQKTWTLEQCIDTALANNRNIKQQKLNYKSKKISHEQAKADRLPNLNASVGQNFNFGRSLGVDNTYQNSNSQNTSMSISSGLTLFNGFRTKNTIEARQAELLAAGADVQKIENDIILNVSSVFLQVLQNKELLQNSENQIQITRENIARRKALINEGKMAQGEIYELQAQEAKEELSRVQAQNQLQLSLLDLSQVLEIDHFEDIDIAVPGNLMDNKIALLSADEVYKSALDSRPEIKSAQYRLESSLKNIEIAKAGYMPSLSLGAQWGTGYYNMSNVPNNNSFGKQFSNNMSSGVGLNLSIPIFNRFEVRTQVDNAKLNVESTKIEIENTKIELRKTIQQAYYNAIAARNRWEASQKTVKANEESYRFANQKSEVGRANLYEVNLAKTNLTQALSEETQAKYEYVFRLKILELMK